MPDESAKRGLPLFGGNQLGGAGREPARTSFPASKVAVWYISNLQRCNFTCSYCASHQPTLQRNRSLPTWARGPATHEAVVDWLVKQSFPFRLRMNSIGEPFVSAPYLQSVARLTRAMHISFVEILTNGSFRKEQFDRFAADCNIEKLSLWITFHHEFISPAELVSAAVHAQRRGAFVVVNALIFPDNAAAVSEVLQRCQDSGVRVSTGFGLNFNNAYPANGRVPGQDSPTEQMLALGGFNNVLGEFHELSAAPAGRPCAAGMRYFLIDPNGLVFPCFTYASSVKSTQLGSALDPEFRLTPQADSYATCVAPGRCRCTEDYQNLEAIQEHFEWTLPTFGIPAPKAYDRN